MKFNISIPWGKIQPAYQQVVKDAAADMTVKGFRKGKAPVDMVEKQLDRAKVYEELIQRLLPGEYDEYIKKNELKPITRPKVTAESIEEGKDWQFQVEIAQKPAVALNDYEKEIKGAKTKSSLWTPEKAKNKQAEGATQEEDQLKLVFEALLKAVEVEVPALLVEQEVNRALSRLINQVNNLGLSLDQYLDSMNKTAETIRQEYAHNIEENLRVEFTLDEIASSKNLKAGLEEVETYLAKIDDKETVKMIKEDPEQLQAIEFSLTRQKVIAYLLAL